MRDQKRYLCVLAAVAALLASVQAAAAERDFRKLVRDWIRAAEKDPGKAREALEKAKKQYEKQRNKEERKQRKEDAKLSLGMVKEAFEKGKKAYDEKRYSEAYLYFQDVARSRHPGAISMADQAKTKLGEIDGMAAARVEQARILMLQQRPVDAAVTLQYVVLNFPFCEASDEARLHLRILKSSPSVAAAVRFAEGKAQETAGNYVEAYRIYEEITSRWSYELGAEEARRAIRDLRADEEKYELIRAAKSEKAEDECKKRLLKAQNFLANDVPELARPELDWIVRNAAGSSYAEDAEALIARIGAPSTDAEGADREGATP